MIVYAVIYKSGCVCFYGGDVLKLKEDIADVKPTVFCSVPRLYNKFYDAIKSKIATLTGLKSALANYAFNSKMHYNNLDNSVDHGLWDSIIFKNSK